MFRGNHLTRLDDKGRLKVPAEFKREIDENYSAQFYITSWDGKSAKVYPMQAWEEIERKLPLAVGAGTSSRVEAPELRDPYARCKIVGAEWTREVVRVGVQNGDALGLAEFAAQGDDMRVRAGASRSRNHIVVDRLDVDDDDIRLSGANVRVGAERRPSDHRAGRLEDRPDQPDEPGVARQNEDGRAASRNPRAHGVRRRGWRNRPMPKSRRRARGRVRPRSLGSIRIS